MEDKTAANGLSRRTADPAQACLAGVGAGPRRGHLVHPWRDLNEGDHPTAAASPENSTRQGASSCGGRWRTDHAAGPTLLGRQGAASGMRADDGEPPARFSPVSGAVGDLVASYRQAEPPITQPATATLATFCSPRLEPKVVLAMAERSPRGYCRLPRRRA